MKPQLEVPPPIGNRRAGVDRSIGDGVPVSRHKRPREAPPVVAAARPTIAVDVSERSIEERDVGCVVGAAFAAHEHVDWGAQ